MKKDGVCTLKPVSLDKIVSSRKRKHWKWAESIRAFLYSGMEAAEVTGIDMPIYTAYSGLSQTAKRIGGVRVVKLRPDGSEVRRYESLQEASMVDGASEKTVRNRCRGQIHGSNGKINEFRRTGTTFRYAEEWDALSAAQRRTELRRAAGVLNTEVQ